MLVRKSICSFETADKRSHIIARHTIHRFGDLPSNNVLRSPPVNGIAKLSTSTVEESFRRTGWGLPEKMAEAECQRTCLLPVGPEHLVSVDIWIAATPGPMQAVSRNLRFLYDAMASIAS